MVNFPKELKSYCRHEQCKNHQDWRVSQYKVRSLLLPSASRRSHRCIGCCPLAQHYFAHRPGLSCWHHITHDNRLAKLPSSLRVSVVMTESRPVSVVRCVHALLPDLLPLLNLRLQLFLTQRFQTKPVFHKKAKVTKKITLRLKCKKCGELFPPPPPPPPPSFPPWFPLFALPRFVSILSSGFVFLSNFRTSFFVV